MERKTGKKGMELVVLLFATLYTAYILYDMYLNKWENIILILVGAIVLVDWVFTIHQIGSFEKRTRFTTIIMIIMIVFKYLCERNFIDTSTIIISIVIIIGMYGEINNILLLGGITILLSMHETYFIIKRLSNCETMEFVRSCIASISSIICIFIWLKGRRRNQIEITRSIVQIKKAENTQEDFLANISHELRTPINNIFGMSEILLGEKDLTKINSSVNKIQAATRNIMGTINDILDFNELKTGKTTIIKENYEAASMIKDIIAATESRIDDMRLEFFVEFDMNIPRVFEGDEQKIRRVIMNLINNAIKFTSEGYIKLKVGGRPEQYGWNLIISVEDTGIGISEKNKERLFRGFGQIDSSRSRNAEGLGLGLAISKALIEKMGGTIGVKSTEGKGSTFSIVVPQTIIDKTRVVTTENENANVLYYLNLEHISYIEIRDAIINNTKNVFSEVNVAHKICNTLSEFKRRISTEKFTHIIISFNEYNEDRNYFLEIAKTYSLYVLVNTYEGDDINDNQIKIFRKPFYTLSLMKILSEKKEITDEFIAPKARILVVDDNKMNLIVIENLLKKYQIGVTTAQSGDEALEKIESQDYDFIFMDYMMPEKDGIETFKEIRQKRGRYFQQVPCIALTANAFSGVREKFLNEGFADFVEKPVEISVLERVLKRNLPIDKIEKIEKIEKSEIIIDKENDEEKETMNIENKNNSENNTVAAEFAIGTLDINQALLYCGSRESLVMILKTFCDSYEKTRKQIVDFHAEENWEQYKILVHAMKSSMKSVGATELSEMAKEIEMLVKNNTPELIGDKHDALMKKYEETFIMVSTDANVGYEAKKEISEEELNKLRELTTEEFDTIIDEFEEAAFTLDEETLAELINKLMDSKYNETALKEMLINVQRKVEHLDLISAYDELVAIRKKF